jgi:hypothetical protein
LPPEHYSAASVDPASKLNPHRSDLSRDPTNSSAIQHQPSPGTLPPPPPPPQTPPSSAGSRGPNPRGGSTPGVAPRAERRNTSQLAQAAQPGPASARELDDCWAESNWARTAGLGLTGSAGIRISNPAGQCGAGGEQSSGEAQGVEVGRGRRARVGESLEGRKGLR